MTARVRHVWMLAAAGALGGGSAASGEAEVVGERPYELDWAGRVADDTPPLIDFERPEGWRVECHDAEASFVRTREQRIWGEHVGKLTYRAAGANPVVRILPPAPVRIEAPFDAVTCWIYGNNWAYARDPETPPVSVEALFADADGRDFGVPLGHVNWQEWFLCHRRLAPDQARRVARGGAFKGLAVAGGRNPKDRVLYFDNLAAFVEAFQPLVFEPRPARGIPMLPGQGTGTHTGPGTLPFPTRPETILPDNLERAFTTSLSEDGGAFLFTYAGADGRLTYRFEPRTGSLGDFTARWEGRGGAIRPCAGGGLLLQGTGPPVAPERAEPLGTARQDEAVVSRWRLRGGGLAADVTYTCRLWNKSLVIDIAAPGGAVGEVRWGRAVGLEAPRLVTLPYYMYGATRPAIAVSGPPDAPLFLAAHTDWCLSNASLPWAVNDVAPEGVALNGGTRYVPKTDGRRNDCFERLFLTLSPRFEEVLPTVPNPVSPWKRVTGTKLWRAHGASPDRAQDVRHWTECRRHGMTEVVVTDHETMWRDGGESFTFRTRAAPKKGGDDGARAYARTMQDALGFVYGPYNNYTDLAPVNGFWHVDRVSRTPENQLQHAWARCYAPKPARAVELCARLAPEIQAKFGFSTAYCDVHTAVAPWDRVDYDARVPGAGTFAAVFYAYGEILLLQKAAWNGPVYSEGNRHFLYGGLADGNYAQDQPYRPATHPWLVDFDLRKLHDLGCNFGMGNPEMFFVDAEDRPLDRFLAATVAFGHPGFLAYEYGLPGALRSYYLLQQLHSRYCLARAAEIRYADAQGRLLDTSAAVATGAFARSQVVTRYTDGTVTAVNGHPAERMAVEACGRRVDLPPDGFAGWTEDGAIDVRSGDPGGRRADYAATPAYLYVDGRGRFVRFPKAAGNGIGICRALPGGAWEVIPVQGAECGFAVSAARATALDRAGQEMGPAMLRAARGLTYVLPVPGAFCYRLDPGEPPASATPACDRDDVVAGETVIVRGTTEHRVVIPRDAAPGSRVWREIAGGWIDFTVVPLADAAVALEGNALRVTLTSRLAKTAEAEVAVGARRQAVRLEPGKAAVTAVDLGAPSAEGEEVLAVEVRAGGHAMTVERGLRTAETWRPLAAIPERWRAGMRLRGREEQVDLGDSGTAVHPQTSTCGGVARPGVFMHPPWKGGTGYAFLEYDPVAIPAAPPAAFRALVGKGDGSTPGDGIEYRVAVVDASGTETVAAKVHVLKHEWLPLEADLAPWAGKTVRLKLVADVGPAGDSGGDWACWAGMRIETRDRMLTRTLDDDPEPYRRGPAPFPIARTEEGDLRKASRGWLRYDGMGLEGGGGAHPTIAVLNGIEVGPMAPAGGDETKGIWAERVGVPLTPEAIRSLRRFNRVVVRNPGRDWFALRRFWIELEWPDGRRGSSLVSTAAFTQPPEWAPGTGIRVPFGRDIEVGISFGP